MQHHPVQVSGSLPSLTMLILTYKPINILHHEKASRRRRNTEETGIRRRRSQTTT
jgi:hypothetical protein